MRKNRLRNGSGGHDYSGLTGRRLQWQGWLRDIRVVFSAVGEACAVGRWVCLPADDDSGIVAAGSGASSISNVSRTGILLLYEMPLSWNFCL